MRVCDVMKNAGMLFENIIDLYYFHKADFNRFSEVTKSIEKDHFLCKKRYLHKFYILSKVLHINI